MTIKQFYFGVEKHNKKYYVTNDDYGVCLKNEKEANMVCNMINSMVKEVNTNAGKLTQTIQEAYENERTALGKSVLKQLLEKLK